MLNPNDKTVKCPKCGDENVYIGAFSIECSSDPECENYTKEQAQKANKEKINDDFPEESPYGFPYLYDTDLDDFYF